MAKEPAGNTTAVTTIGVFGPEIDDELTAEEENEFEEIRLAGESFHSEREWYGKAFHHLNVTIHPQEVQMEEEKDFFSHSITNNSKFPVVCRLLSSAGMILSVVEGPFIIIQPHCVHFMQVEKHRGPTKRTELLAIDCMPIDSTFQKLDEWEQRVSELFEIGRQPVRYKIRYRKEPRYAQEVNKVLHKNMEIKLEKNVSNHIPKLFGNDASTSLSFKSFILLDLFCKLMWPAEKEKTKTEEK